MGIDRLLAEVEQEELKQEDLKRRQYEAVLMQHPNCRDPDHPGCEKCKEQTDEAG